MPRRFNSFPRISESLDRRLCTEDAEEEPLEPDVSDKGGELIRLGVMY